MLAFVFEASKNTCFYHWNWFFICLCSFL